MNDACDDANYGQKCLNFYVDYTTRKKGPDKECKVDDVKPEVGTEVTTRTRVTLTVSCGESEEDTSQTNNNTTDEENSQTSNNTTSKNKNENERGE